MPRAYDEDGDNLPVPIEQPVVTTLALEQIAAAPYKIFPVTVGHRQKSVMEIPVFYTEQEKARPCPAKFN